MHILAYLADALALNLFQTLARTHRRIADPHIDTLVDALCYLRFRHFQTVNGSLSEEEFLHSYLLWYAAVGIFAPVVTVEIALQTRHFDVGLEYRLVAYHPYHLVDHGAALFGNS